MAAVLAGGKGAFLSHWASCALAGLVRWDGRPIDVTVRGSAERSRPGIRFHRVRSLQTEDVTRLHGIPTTTPARAILEVAPQLSDHRLKRVVRKAQAEKRANVGRSPMSCAAPTAIERRSGSPRSSIPGPRRPPAVTRTSCSTSSCGPASNIPSSTSRYGVSANPYTPDLRWPAERLILEIDSSPWHDGPLAEQLDADRQAELEAAGERVLRTTRDQAIVAPRQLVARLLAAGAPLARRGGPHNTLLH